MFENQGQYKPLEEAGRDQSPFREAETGNVQAFRNTRQTRVKRHKPSVIPRRKNW